jgi:hypothetical protein
MGNSTLRSVEPLIRRLTCRREEQEEKTTSEQKDRHWASPITYLTYDFEEICAGYTDVSNMAKNCTWAIERASRGHFHIAYTSQPHIHNKSLE